MNPGHGTPLFGEVCMHFNVPSSFHIYEILHKKKQLELISGITVATIHHISLKWCTWLQYHSLQNIDGLYSPLLSTTVT